jgi:hypothetical protein
VLGFHFFVEIGVLLEVYGILVFGDDDPYFLGGAL